MIDPSPLSHNEHYPKIGVPRDLYLAIKSMAIHLGIPMSQVVRISFNHAKPKLQRLAPDK